MSIVFFWFVFAIIVGVAANSRGRSGFGWFLLSVLLSPLLAGLLVLALPSLNASTGGAFRPDGMLGQIPFRKLPNGEVEALIQGSPVRFRNVAEMKVMADPTATIVTVIQPEPPPAFNSQIAIAIAVTIAVIAIACLIGAN